MTRRLLVVLTTATVASGALLQASASAHPATVPSHHDKVAAVQAQLRDLAVAEETFFTDHGHYTSNMAALRQENYVPDPHTTVHVAWHDGAKDYCLTGRYRKADRTKRSYDAMRGGLTGPRFRCSAHRPAATS